MHMTTLVIVFEALARTHTVMFDKTGTLTIGGASGRGQRPKRLRRDDKA